jgi:hypothetical protein
METFKPPRHYYPEDKSVFLAGSIEMGKAEDWQAEVERALEEFDDIVVFNPRRDDWDSSWEQSTSNEKFVEQVQWEMTHLRKADVIFMYLSPGTISPISLLELGWQHDSEILVCCPEGYFRRGNVEIFCDYCHIPFYSNLGDAIEGLKNILLHT